MIDGLKPYPAYKSSGVPWLGDVPEHWEVERLKSRVINFVEQISDLEFCEPYIALEHVESWTGRLKQIETNAVFDSQVKRFYAGDVLFGRLRPYLAKVVRSNLSGVCVNEFFVLRPRGCNLRDDYLEQLLRSKPIIDAINSSTFGAKMPRADWQFVGNMQMPFPTLPEQQAIVRFLEYADRRIRRYIRAKQKLIKLLNEQKQAIIHRAVTRGLDSSVRLKSSGVLWLGDIPEHWEMRRLKHLVRNVNEQTDTKSPDEVYIALEHVESWTGRLVLAEREVMFESQVKRFRPNDILFGKLRPYLAKVTRPQRNGVCVGEFLVLRVVAPMILPEFLEQKLRSKQLIDLINSSTFGAKMPRAEWAFIGNVVIAYPPTHQEQQMILDQIKQETALLSSAITAAQREIELLREYRTRLVADVVTGKLDVRGVEVPAPEEEGEEEEPAVEMEEEMEETEEAEEVEADAGD